jgi:tRNA nucleotidyltransferase (CCA-adding enzyme)
MTLTPKHVGHSDVAAFADAKVNLRADDLKKYRDQANRVCTHIERYIDQNPDVGFVKTRLSGSLAKHTAGRGLSDIDIALYVKPEDEKGTNDLNSLLLWVRSQLQKTYPSTTIEIEAPCVEIRFSDGYLNVEIMPVLVEDAKSDYGRIWLPGSLESAWTNIPRHLEFLAKRRVAHKPHFAQVVRLLKKWKSVQGLNFRSFLIELLAARMADEQVDFSDYPNALIAFFNSILRDDMEAPVIFTDYFKKSEFPDDTSSAITIWDPVTPTNNVAMDYSFSEKVAILKAVEDAADRLTYAARCSTKAEAVENWKAVFGPSFSLN